MSARFTGVIPPTLTPLDADERLDRPAVRRMVGFLLENGMDGLFILGSTGEGPTLRPAVRHEMAEATVEAVAGRAPVIAGVLETATARVIDEVRALENRGLDGYVVTSPFYFAGYGDDDLYDHFRRVAGTTDLPILLYNIPQTTKVSLSAKLVRRLSEIPNVVGIKDSSGNWTEFQSMVLERTSPDFVVLQGMQSLCAASLVAGGNGLVPGHGNVYPRLTADLYAAAKRGDVAQAFEYQGRLDRLIRIRGRAPVHGIKVLARALGLMDDYLTAPLPRLTAAESDELVAANVAAGVKLPVGARV